MHLQRLANAVINKLESKRRPATPLSLPTYVDVVLTKHCNLACRFCNDYETDGAQNQSLPAFERIAAKLLPTAKQLSICSGGEPYLHRHLLDILRVARSYGVRVWLLSNGMLCDEARLRAIVEENLVTEHGFSVDGIEAATVEAIRINARLPVILANIDTLLRLRRDAGAGLPRVVIRYAVMRSNLAELPAAVTYWGERGIDRIEVNYLSLCNDIDRDESLYFHQERMVEVFDRARAEAAGFDQLTLKLPPTVAAEQDAASHPRPCMDPWKFVYIDTNGDVFPCYHSWSAVRMGNLLDAGASFAKIWRSRPYAALRRSVNDDAVAKHHPFCARCEARFGLGTLAAHLGSETWFEGMGLAGEELADARQKRKR
ncbi:MAG: radical SAM protein [Candidatus Krumholzibacteriia bacterium]